MADTPQQRPTAAMVAKAAEWAAILDDAPVPQAQRDACEAWCREHPLHRLALERMRSLDGRFTGLTRLDRQVLRTVTARTFPGPRAQRQGLSGVLALLVGLGAWYGADSPRVRSLFPDARTDRGEVRTLALADGSGLVVDTQTALDVRITGGGRQVDLFDGRVLAQVAHDPGRPFTIRTGDGTVTALGTAFSVHRDGRRTLVTVIASRVRACPAAAGDCLELGAGDRALMTQGGVSRLPPVDPATAAAWTTGWLVVDDQPLTDVLAELNRYRAQPIRFDATGLRDIRVTGSYPLGDTDRALQAMAAALGVRVVPLGDGGVTVLAGPR